MATFAAGDLVNLVQKNNARVFHTINRHTSHLIHVNQALFFFLDQVFEGFADLHLPLLGALAEDIRQHIFDIDIHLLDALIGDDFKRGERFFTDLDFHHAPVELAFTQLLAQLFSGPGM